MKFDKLKLLQCNTITILIIFQTKIEQKMYFGLFLYQTEYYTHFCKVVIQFIFNSFIYFTIF